MVVVVEVEFVSSRGFESLASDDDEEEDVPTLEVSMCLGENGEKQWHGLGPARLSSFVRTRCRNRYCLVSKEEATLHLEVYKRKKKKEKKSMFEFLKPKDESCLVGYCDVQPWFVGGERWVLLREKNRCVHRRRELKLCATLSKADKKSDAADAVTPWFNPIERWIPPTSNVARLGIIHALDLPSGGNCYVAARAVASSSSTAPEFNGGESPDRPRPKHLLGGAVATTRVAEDGVWMQTLTLALEDLEHENVVEIGVFHQNDPKKPIGRTVVEGMPDDGVPFWIKIGDCCVKIALVLDYDELLDPAEARPFFPEELYPGFKDELVEPGAPLRKCNALRVVVARCKHLEVYSEKRRIIVSHGSAAKSTLAKMPALDGSVVWNECFEFFYDEPSDVQVAGVSVYAPDRRLLRRWYKLPPSEGGGEILVASKRFWDPSVDAVEERRKATEQLALAFPDVHRSDLERVYDSTGNVSEACVALGAYTGIKRSEDDAEMEFVAACNATDLGWVLAPIDEAADEFEDAHLLLPRQQQSSKDRDDRRRAAIQKNKPPLFRVGTGASLLNKKQSIDMIRAQSLRDMTHAFLFKNPDKPSLDVDDEVVDEEDAGRTRRDTLNSETIIVSALVEDGAIRETKTIDRQDTASTTTSTESSESIARMKAMLSGSGRKKKAAVTVRTSIDPAAASLTPVLRARFEKTPFELARVYLDVRRTPRDFVTLRAGLLNKLRGAKPGDDDYVSGSAARALAAGGAGSADDEIPPLPNWVRRSLNLKITKQRASVAAVSAAGAMAGAIAFATGIAPILAVSGAVALGGAALVGARKTTKTIARKRIDASIAKCEWIDKVRQLLAAMPPSKTTEEATTFFKLFVAHGGKIALWQKARDDRDSFSSADDFPGNKTRRRRSGLLDVKALEEIREDEDNVQSSLPPPGSNNNNEERDDEDYRQATRWSTSSSSSSSSSKQQHEDNGIVEMDLIHLHDHDQAVAKRPVVELEVIRTRGASTDSKQSRASDEVKEEAKEEVLRPTLLSEVSATEWPPPTPPERDY